MLRVRSLLLVTATAAITGLGLVGTTACAGPCKKVASQRRAFLEPPAASSDPHLRVSVPFDVVAVLMARELRQLESFRVPIPAVSGVSLGSVTGGVEQIRLVAAPPGQVGFVVKVALRSGRKKVLEVDLDARTTPRIDLETGTVSVALSAQDVRRVRPKLGPGARKSLRDFVWAELPSTVKTLVSKKQLEALLGGVTDQLLGEVAESVRRDLADEIGEVASFELELPDLPLSALAVGSTQGALTLTGRTSLPVAHGVPERPRHASVHQNAVELRMSGELATALGNWAIDRGEIPGRYGLDGQPDPRGDFLANVGWARAEPKPLVVHLWTAEDGEMARKKQCAHVQLRATPAITAGQGDLEISTRDAQVDQVEGSARVRAGVFFSGIGRQTFELVETVAGRFELDLGAEPLQASVHSAVIDGDELVLGLVVRPQPGRPRR